MRPIERALKSRRPWMRSGRGSSMKQDRNVQLPNSLLLAAMGIAVASGAGLMAFPDNPRVWQLEAWVLVVALLAVAGLVMACGYMLATRRAARTWQRIATFSMGVVMLAVVGIGSL